MSRFDLRQGYVARFRCCRVVSAADSRTAATNFRQCDKAERRRVETMTELSPARLRSIRWTVTLAASLGWFFDAYVITIYALTVPLIAAEFHLATNILSGAVGSIFLLGYTIGTIGF